MRTHLVVISLERADISVPQPYSYWGLAMGESPDLETLLTGPTPEATGVIDAGAYRFHQSGPNRLETECVPTIFSSLMHGSFTVSIKIFVGMELHTGHVVTPEEAEGHAVAAARAAATAVARLLDWGNGPSGAAKAFKDYTQEILKKTHPTYGYQVQNCHGS
jgi:hypothetical protein